MKIHFPRLYRYERRAEHCSVALPFPKGVCRDSMRLRILDGTRELPVQTKVTSRYDDGSVRYLFARFTADLPGNQRKDFDAELVPGPAPAAEGLRVSRSGSRTVIDGCEGGLQIELADNGTQLLASLRDGGRLYSADRFAGPFLKDGGGQSYALRFSEWRTLEAGPLVAVLRCEGDLLPDGEADAALPDEHPRFEAGLTVYAGKPWVEISFRLINTTSAPLHAASLVFSLLPDGKAGAGDASDTVYRTTGVKELPKIEAQLQDSDVRCCVGRSNYKTDFLVSGGAPVESVIDTDYLLYEANEHFTEVFFGTFFADRTDRQGGVCATVFQAQQNYPKAVWSDAGGISVMLVPENVEQVVLQSGMSREQRFLLHFHDAQTPLAEIDNRSLLYQMPDKPWIDPDQFRDAGVSPDIFVRPEDADAAVEMSLISHCDAHSRSFGMLNFGDAPDPGYTGQGRGKGMYVWTNNEYDFPHACALLYMRTGERRFLDYMIASASHWMDVDVCHYSSDPLLYGGQWEHSRCHVLDSAIVCSHQWVEGLLDYYHFTGDERALDTALGIGANVLRLLDTPPYQVSGENNARETGWALRSLTALYIETGDRKWLEKAEWIIGHFREWTRMYGSWVSPYTDNTLIHVTFMIAVAMGSLYRYYKVFPGEELREMLLAAADDLVDNCMLPTGLFFYKELPSLNRLGNNTLILEAMTIAYDLTGDLRYLRAGLPTFRMSLGMPSSILGRKIASEGTVVLQGAPTKGFAQSFIPLSVFYKAAAQNGLLRN
jgi:hypothetical protein